MNPKTKKNKKITKNGDTIVNLNNISTNPNNHSDAIPVKNTNDNSKLDKYSLNTIKDKKSKWL